MPKNYPQIQQHQPLPPTRLCLTVVGNSVFFFLKYVFILNFTFSLFLCIFFPAPQGSEPPFQFASFICFAALGASGFCTPPTCSQPIVGWMEPNPARSHPRHLGLSRGSRSPSKPQRGTRAAGGLWVCSAGSCPISLPGERKGDQTQTRSIFPCAEQHGRAGVEATQLITAMSGTSGTMEPTFLPPFLMLPWGWVSPGEAK